MRLATCIFCFFVFISVKALPISLLYDYNVPEAIRLPKGDDISSEEIVLREPLVFFGISFDTVYVSTYIQYWT